MQLKIKIPKAAWVEEWMMKEYGAWEDEKHDPAHPCAILQQRGKTVDLSQDQINKLIESGRYHSTAWDDDNIEGGQRTKTAIANYTHRLKSLAQLVF